MRRNVIVITGATGRIVANTLLDRDMPVRVLSVLVTVFSDLLMGCHGQVRGNQGP